MQPALPFDEGGGQGTCHHVHLAEAFEVLAALEDESVDLCYLDPPFNTGKVQQVRRLKTSRSDHGDRTGFGGRRYSSEVVSEMAYSDQHEDYLGFLEERLREVHRVLAPHGSLYLHLDSREVHRVKLLLDEVFGAESFRNEIIWAYDFGGRPRDRWPAKHDNILFYAKDPGLCFFDTEEVERIPYMAPGLVGKEKAARGKLPTDVWWHTIVPTSGKERTGYPTQKPLGILKRIVAASSRRGDLVVDVFAGSGTTGAACIELGRRFLLADTNPEALAVMARRFEGVQGVCWHHWEPDS